MEIRYKCVVRVNSTKNEFSLGSIYVRVFVFMQSKVLEKAISQSFFLRAQHLIVRVALQLKARISTYHARVLRSSEVLLADRSAKARLYAYV